LSPAIRIAAISACALLACAPTQTRSRETQPLALEFMDSLRLDSPVVDFCYDGSNLLLAENTGASIYQVGLDLRFLPPLALPSRVPGIRGLAADPFYVYLADDSRLYRLDRSEGQLVAVGSSIRARSPAMLAGGQVGFIDGFSGRLLALDPNQGVVDQGAQRPGLQPGALAFGPDNNLYVLNQARQELVVFDRLGSVVHAWSLPGAGMRLGVDDSLNAYVLESSGQRIVQIGRRGNRAAVSARELGMSFAGSNLLAVGNRLYVLDQGRRLLEFRLRPD
jgi:hypothetical protein